MNNYYAAEENKNYQYAGLIIYLLLLIFTPYFKIAGRDNFELTFAVTLIFILFLPKTLRRYGSKQNVTMNSILSILAIIFITDCISILNYIRLNGLTNIAANVVPNFKVGLYILVVSALYSIDLDREHIKKFIRNVIPAIGILLSVIAVFQMFNLFYFNSWFTKYYISSESGKVLNEFLKESTGTLRVLGTLSNPNFFSLELLIFFAFSVSNILFGNSKKQKAANIFASLLLFIAIVFTQSRTALFTLFLILLYIAVIQAVRRGRKYIFVYGGVLLLIIGVSLLLIKVMDLSYLFEALKSGAETRSVTQRLDRWKDAVNLFKLHPIVGIGPVIGKYFSAVDNEYFQILRNYGIVGLAAHLSFYLYILIMSAKDLFNRNDEVTLQYAFAVNCSVLSVLVCNITLAVFYHWRNFVLLLILCCMWAKSKRSADCAGY